MPADGRSSLGEKSSEGEGKPETERDVASEKVLQAFPTKWLSVNAFTA
jgi:hypothetical protein